MPPAKAPAKRAPAKKAAKPAEDRTTAYARAVLDGEILAGRMVRAACLRHLADMETGAARGLLFRQEKALHAFRFFEGLCRLAGGASEGLPFILQPWQAFIVGSLFGWYSGDVRRFRVAYIEAGKGSGKSPLLAGIGLYMLMADSEPRAEVYAAAVKKDQAMILFRDAVAMVDQSPDLAARIQKSGATGREWNLAFAETNSFFRAISSDDNSQSGPRPHCGLIDEVHEHKTPAVVDMMRAGTKGRRQALICMITNSGFDRHSVAWQHHEYTDKIVSGVLRNDAWFGYVCGLDACEPCREQGRTQPHDGCESCDDWRDERVWLKANPNLGVSIHRSYLEEQVREAEGLTAKQGIVKRLNFCIWTESRERWIDVDLWDACAADIDVASLRGARCYGGLDLSSTTDLSAFVLAFPGHGVDEPIRVLAWFWCPKESMLKRSKLDRVPYDQWAREGYLEPTEGDVIDYDVIRDRIRSLASVYEIAEIGFDPYNAQQLVTQLTGDGLLMVPVRQGGLTLSPPTKALEVRIKQRSIRHDGHPILRWNISNCCAIPGAGETIKLGKSGDKMRIDGVAALVCAMERMDRHLLSESQSVYDTGGVLLL